MLTSNSRVLIADGETDLRKRLRSELLALDVFSDCVTDGKGALAALQERPYAVVVVDLALEKIQAAQVIEAIGALPAPRPMVLATTNSDGRPTIDSELVQIILRKPFAVDDIAEIIRSCIAASRASQRPARGASVTSQPSSRKAATAASRDGSFTSR